ncbi:MAG: hypothetical protein ILP19_10285 [Oscillospiraceae bacterium]|nr:hypothetical protein [Oscillospiraceae bacterium]
MSFSYGDYVIYGGTQMCTVGETEIRCFDGVHEQSYVKLIPVDQPGSSYYVQSDKMTERVRHLLSRAQVFAVIDSMPGIESSWINDRVARRDMFSEVFRSDDYSRLIAMMKGLITERRRRIKIGKTLISDDEKALKTASNLINSEFSRVLGIDADEVDSFIEKRIGKL